MLFIRRWNNTNPLTAIITTTTTTPKRYVMHPIRTTKVKRAKTMVYFLDGPANALPCTLTLTHRQNHRNSCRHRRCDRHCPIVAVVNNDAMRMSILVDILLNRKTILAVVGQGVCRYVLIFLPMDGPTYTVERQTESYVTRYAGM
jgi:hypothetical protein